MAPRKEKVEKVSGDAAANTILKYLRKQNRPYSATDISANLHNAISKAATAKFLKELHEKKEIEGRASGKQIVYHAIQSPSSSATPEDLAAIDAQTATLREETVSLLAEAKTLRSTLSSLTATLSTANVRTAVATLEAEKAEVTARLQGLRGGTVKPVSKEEKDKVERALREMRAVEGRRGKIVRGMWETVVDFAGGEGLDLGQLRENLGLDE